MLQVVTYEFNELVFDCDIMEFLINQQEFLVDFHTPMYEIYQKGLSLFWRAFILDTLQKNGTFSLLVLRNRIHHEQAYQKTVSDLYKQQKDRYSLAELL